MKKYIIFALIFAILCSLTLTLSLIFLDPLTAIIVWLFSIITSLSCFACFLQYYNSNPQKKELEEIKEKLSALQKEPYNGAPSSVIYTNRYKGKVEGLNRALEIIQEYLDKNQQ